MFGIRDPGRGGRRSSRRLSRTSSLIHDSSFSRFAPSPARAVGVTRLVQPHSGVGSEQLPRYQNRADCSRGSGRPELPPIESEPIRVNSSRPAEAEVGTAPMLPTEREGGAARWSSRIAPVVILRSRPRGGRPWACLRNVVLPNEPRELSAPRSRLRAPSRCSRSVGSMVRGDPSAPPRSGRGDPQRLRTVGSIMRVGLAASVPGSRACPPDGSEPHSGSREVAR